MNSVPLTEADVTLVLNQDGVIQEVTLSHALADEPVDAWIGRLWEDTVSDSGDAKVKHIVKGLQDHQVSVFGQITQCFPSGRRLLMEYTTVRLRGKTGLIAVGKSLQAITELQSRLIAAQQTMERDYWKLREVETRYRLLFDASNEAVLLLRAQDLQVIEANPAAIRTLDHQSLVGQNFLQHLSDVERIPFQAMLLRVRDQGKAPAARVHLGKLREPCLVRASLMPSDLGPAFLLQLTTTKSTASARDDAIPVEPFMERSPEGFVIIDQEGIVRRVNQAFLDLIQFSTESAVIGQPLQRWLGKPGADVNALLLQIKQYGSVRLFSTMLHGELGMDTAVEIAASGNTCNPQYLGLLIRDASGRLSLPAHHGNLAEQLMALVEQVGQTSLRQLIRETTGVLECHYIKAALELTGGNRTAAAELLGLSRQSLYVKLNQHGLGIDSVPVTTRSAIDKTS